MVVVFVYQNTVGKKNYSCAGNAGDTLDTPSVSMANGAPVEVSSIYVYYSVEFVSVVTDYSAMKGMKKWQFRRNASC